LSVSEHLGTEILFFAERCPSDAQLLARKEF
jgi:hypothetical protein